MLFTLLFACQPTEIEMSSEVQGCQNWNPSEDNVPVLEITRDGDDVLIYRNYVDQYCDAEFTPTLDVLSQYKVSIRESWTVQNNDCSSCSAPTVRLHDYQGDFFEFWWYIGDSAISFNVINTDELNE